MPDCSDCQIFQSGMDSSACMHIHRPGGLELTNLALNFIDLEENAPVIDLACGACETVNFLKKDRKFSAIGVDRSKKMLETGLSKYPSLNLLEADCEHIPLPGSTQQAVLMECALMLSGNADLVLNEIHRVLTPEGKLIITDVFIREVIDDIGLKSLAASSCLSHANTKDEIIHCINNAGFQVIFWSDQTALFKKWLAQMVFKFGSLQSFYQKLCTSEEGACELSQVFGNSIKLGYYLLIVQNQ